MFMESDGKRRLIRIAVWVAVLGLLIGVLSSLATAVSGSAHTALASVSPEDGSRLTQAPEQVVLTFSEPVSSSFATVTVTGPTGPATEDRAQVSGTTVTQRLTAVASSGDYTVAFRVVSSDGHPVSDRTTFSLALGAEATGQATLSTDPDTAPSQSPGAPARNGQAGETRVTAGGSGNANGLLTPVILTVAAAVAALAAATALVAPRRRGGAP